MMTRAMVAVALMGLAGCAEPSERVYSVDPKTGVFSASIKGADIKAASIKLTAPNGFSLDVEGVQGQDRLAELSAQASMYNSYVTGSIMSKVLPAALSKLGIAMEAVTILPPSGLRVTPSILVPTTQPAGK